ncbi:hypothetical protein KIW84_013548 [Lathyrus oleraceus]|uniref:Uncharacterized protein n=1 Tax=Pisum sativum TaxID=3888 RepID=A0A9D5BKQ2_PEA|nr:hypothetical protein KIW84_013548 [Pisum sativum]
MGLPNKRLRRKMAEFLIWKEVKTPYQRLIRKWGDEILVQKVTGTLGHKVRWGFSHKRDLLLQQTTTAPWQEKRNLQTQLRKKDRQISLTKGSNDTVAQVNGPSKQKVKKKDGRISHMEGSENSLPKVNKKMGDEILVQKVTGTLGHKVRWGFSHKSNGTIAQENGPSKQKVKKKDGRISHMEGSENSLPKVNKKMGDEILVQKVTGTLGHKVHWGFSHKRQVNQLKRDLLLQQTTTAPWQEKQNLQTQLRKKDRQISLTKGSNGTVAQENGPSKQKVKKKDGRISHKEGSENSLPKVNKKMGDEILVQKVTRALGHKVRWGFSHKRQVNQLKRDLLLQQTTTAPWQEKRNLQTQLRKKDRQISLTKGSNGTIAQENGPSKQKVKKKDGRISHMEGSENSLPKVNKKMRDEILVQKVTGALGHKVRWGFSHKRDLLLQQTTTAPWQEKRNLQTQLRKKDRQISLTKGSNGTVAQENGPSKQKVKKKDGRISHMEGSENSFPKINKKMGDEMIVQKVKGTLGHKVRWGFSHKRDLLLQQTSTTPWQEKRNLQTQLRKKDRQISLTKGSNGTVAQENGPSKQKVQKKNGRISHMEGSEDSLPKVNKKMWDEILVQKVTGTLGHKTATAPWQEKRNLQTQLRKKDRQISVTKGSNGTVAQENGPSKQKVKKKDGRISHMEGSENSLPKVNKKMGDEILVPKVTETLGHKVRWGFSHKSNGIVAQENGHSKQKAKKKDGRISHMEGSENSLPKVNKKLGDEILVQKVTGTLGHKTTTTPWQEKRNLQTQLRKKDRQISITKGSNGTVAQENGPSKQKVKKKNGRISHMEGSENSLPKVNKKMGDEILVQKVTGTLGHKTATAPWQEKRNLQTQLRKKDRQISITKGSNGTVAQENGPSKQKVKKKNGRISHMEGSENSLPKVNKKMGDEILVQKVTGTLGHKVRSNGTLAQENGPSKQKVKKKDGRISHMEGSENSLPKVNKKMGDEILVQKVTGTLGHKVCWGFSHKRQRDVLLKASKSSEMGLLLQQTATAPWQEKRNLQTQLRKKDRQISLTKGSNGTVAQENGPSKQKVKKKNGRISSMEGSENSLPKVNKKMGDEILVQKVTGTLGHKVRWGFSHKR